MPEIGITKEAAEKMKAAIKERDGGITNDNAEELLKIDKMVSEAPLTREQGNTIRDAEGLTNFTQEEAPVTVVTAPQTAVVERPIEFNEDAVALIKAKVAPNATKTEFDLLMYLSRKYNLDPILRQIWLVKFGDSPAQIYAGRDGYLEIAHRSGHFDGMKSWVVYDENNKPYKGCCTIWRNDMQHPFETEVLFSEYTTGRNLWKDKPSVMLIKVAESVCLRKAFRVSGLYSPEEMGD